MCGFGGGAAKTKLIIQLSASNGTSLAGQAVTVTELNSGLEIASFSYSGQPETLKLPAGITYKVSTVDRMAFVTPEPVTGVLVDDTTVVLSFMACTRYGYRREKANSDPNTRITYLFDAVGKEPMYVNLSTHAPVWGDWKDFVYEVATPVMLNTDGTEAYDIGIEKTYATLFRRLARIPSSVTPRPGTLGVLGATTLDYGADAETTLGNALRTNAKSLRLYGLSHDVTHYIDAAQNERNLVIAPSGLRAAQWLQKTFGTPYDIADPLAASVLPHLTLPRTAKNILILHHQITANTLRTHLQRHYPDALITCATYFRQIGAITKPQDLKLREESDLPALITEKHYDLILGDPLYKRTIPACSGTWIPLPHPAVSGF